MEVYYNGQWGKVCDDGWDLNDAQVVCRQLNLGQALVAVSNSFYGRGTGRIWLDDVNCAGRESSIRSCRHSGWGTGICSQGENAGVLCSTKGMNFQIMHTKYIKQINIFYHQNQALVIF